MKKKAPLLAVVTLSAASLAACEIRVGPDEGKSPRDVDVDTPLGDLTVRGDAVPADVGVAVYPGARPLENGDETERANVTLSSPFVDLRVAALKYLSDDQPDAIAEFYRKELSAYGEVTVCRGDLDFDDDDTPRCKTGRGGRGQMQVGVGSKGNFRLASVKPRGTGSEFAVVYVRASNDL